MNLLRYKHYILLTFLSSKSIPSVGWLGLLSKLSILFTAEKEQEVARIKTRPDPDTNPEPH